MELFPARRTVCCLPPRVLPVLATFAIACSLLLVPAVLHIHMLRSPHPANAAIISKHPEHERASRFLPLATSDLLRAADPQLTAPGRGEVNGSDGRVDELDRLHHFTVVVRRLDRAVDFYSKACQLFDLCEGVCWALVCAHLFTGLLPDSSLTSPQVLRLQQVVRTDTRFPGAWFRIPTVADIARHSGAPLSGAAVLHLVVSESHSPPPRMVLHGAHHGLLVSVGGDYSAAASGSQTRWEASPLRDVANGPIPLFFFVVGLCRIHSSSTRVHGLPLWVINIARCFGCRGVFLAVVLRLTHSTSIQVHGLPLWVLRLRNAGARVVLSPTQVGTRSGLACCCPSSIIQS